MDRINLEEIFANAPYFGERKDRVCQRGEYAKIAANHLRFNALGGKRERAFSFEGLVKELAKSQIFGNSTEASEILPNMIGYGVVYDENRKKEKTLRFRTERNANGKREYIIYIEERKKN